MTDDDQPKLPASNQPSLDQPHSEGTSIPAPDDVQLPATALNDSQVKISKNDQGHTIQSKQIGRYKVEVIRDKCIGAASCVAIAPQVFQLDQEKIAIIISQDGNDDSTKLLAAQSCPTAAIIVTDTQTGQQVWPLPVA